MAALARQPAADNASGGHELVPGQQAQQGGLARAVGSGDLPVLALVQAPGDVVQYLVAVNVNRHVFQSQQDAARGAVRRAAFPAPRGRGGKNGGRGVRQTSLADVAALAAPVRNFFGPVRGQNHGTAPGVFLQHVEKDFFVGRIQAVGTFVQQQEGGRAQQGPAQKQQAQLALRKSGQAAGQQAQGLQARGQGLHGGGLPVTPGHAGTTVEQGGVLQAGEQQVAARDVPGLTLVAFLLGRGDQGGHGASGQGRFLRALLRMPVNMAACGPEFAAQQAQQGGFARAVGAQQGTVPPAFHSPVDMVQYHFLAGIAGQKQADAVHRDQGGGARGGRRGRKAKRRHAGGLRFTGGGSSCGPCRKTHVP